MTIQAKVAEILSHEILALNKGSKDNVVEGMTFLIYIKGKELFDPDDPKKSLGHIEIEKGRCKVIRVAESYCIAQLVPKVVSRKYIEPASMSSLTATMAFITSMTRQFEEVTELPRMAAPKQSGLDKLESEELIKEGDNARNIHVSHVSQK